MAMNSRKGLTPDALEAGGAGERSSKAEPADFDTVIVTDMTIEGDRAFRIALDTHAEAVLGHRVALLHLPSARSGEKIASDIQGNVTAGFAHPIGPGQAVTAKTVRVYAPELIRKVPQILDSIDAEDCTVVVDASPAAHFPRLDGWLRRRFGSVCWVPTNPQIRAPLQRMSLANTAADEWPFRPGPFPAYRPERQLTIGYFGAAPDDWPADLDTMIELLPPDGGVEALLLGSVPAALKRVPHRWKLLDLGAMSLGRFSRRLDVLLYFPARLEDRGPAALVAWMLAAGRTVLMPPQVESAFGKGPTYCRPGDVARLLRKQILAAPHSPPAKSGVTATPRHLPSPASQPPRQKVLFLASNGIGLGHVTRLLAIARRCRRIEPVFVTMGQSAEIVQSYGFTAHYLPSFSYLAADLDDWDGWLQGEMESLIDLWNAAAVIYDGNGPTPGLARAIGSRGLCQFVWIRGGMIGRAEMVHVENARYCDLIIEPGELADQVDTGVTRYRRHEVTLVDPILLLDRRELLPKVKARTALGLDTQKPAVLIQLGAGANRDIISLVEQVMAALRPHPQIQVCIGEWASGVEIPPLWPEATVLSGHPFARYYHAFDFAISAAGYSTFHDTMLAALPTIFIANAQPTMDDQRGRARYAQEQELALEVDEAHLHGLPAMIDVLAAKSAQAYLRRNCRRTKVPNGAATAARLIESMLETSA